MLGARAHVWRPYLDDPAAMLEQGMDIRGWVAAGLLAVLPPDLATLEERLFAAAEAGDWALADALAARHTDAAGARLFVEQMRQGAVGEQAEVVNKLCAICVLPPTVAGAMMSAHTTQGA
jgi:hypothetical protein